MYKPDQHLVVGGVDLFDEWGLSLLDGWELPYPRPKVYEIDIPGGDGSIDVTEAVFGDVAYQSRECSFELIYVGGGDFREVRDAVASAIDGRRLDFSASWEPGCTFTGRWAVDAWYPEVHSGRMKLTCIADPYKLREHRVVRMAGGAGGTYVLECGRKRQCPAVECASECEVRVGGGPAVRLQPGSWTDTRLWLVQGDNEVFVNTTLTGGDVPLSAYAGRTIRSLSGRTLVSLSWSERPDDSEGLAVYFAYDILDL